ncbi:sigma 54-interacting transcriptional regulator [Enterococcus phoeniculicola]|uniref:Uncharacterized protein n=1 Tax=Enterococcus phoeniculicola ATCC BAA-412 TaxID=1158610 RepID=R3TW00_9ENTE|nr:sigma 54-interacting transcriptional regulator [Enterococcus phoeniculicola]EOL45328.1 hypothetical protein UC3_01218 [Enterococcus phoeniculicola ATCC BAA-412]EOT74690.1 hypothetical protein I589_02290 [Enterococcus phoeniculicola ATCC BAA-412]
MLKNKIIACIEQQTQHFIDTQETIGLTAREISLELSQKRNTVSKYLNQLLEQGKLIKITSRPVLFLAKDLLLACGYSIERTVYESLTQLTQQSEQVFSKLIGSEGSLRTAVQQIESAIMYPDNGLPLILFGASGSGKSYIASLAHQYAINQHCIKQDAPLIILNCAQYANNPELLSSLLFGYTKGAFTGAEEEKSGLLAAADGGFLFLDEVHRLSPESQEKLFIFIDKGVYTPLGEVKETKTAHVRLIFATTENREQFLLTTFIRRIPIQIELPELIDRREKERLELIYHFFKEEASILNATISISNRMIHVLLNYTFKGNVGELKNIIKYLCALQYRKKKNNSQLVINTSILPDEMYPLPDNLDLLGPVKNIIISDQTNILELQGLGTSNDLSKIDKLFDEIILLYKELDHNLSKNDFLKKVLLKVDLMMDSLVFNQPNESNRLLLQMINRKVKTIMEFLEDEDRLKVFSTSVFSISNYVFYRMQQTILKEESQDSSLLGLKNFLINNYSDSYENARNMILLLENKFDIYLHSKDEILLTFYIISSNILHQQSNQIKALILAHGFATASSLANVGNRLLNQHIFDAFDMSLDTTAQEIGRNVDDYIRGNKICQEFIILVDMGSLQEIEKFIHPNNQITIGIINNVTTSFVLQVGQMIISRESPETIINHIQQHHTLDVKLHLPVKNQRKVLITTCMTGIGTANQIKHLLEESLHPDYGIEVLAMDYHSLKHNNIGEQLQLTEIIALIGTDNPKINDVPYIPLEKLISGEDDVLTEALTPLLTIEKIEEVNRKIIKNFSLEKVIESITILDSETVINEIEEIISQLEILFNRKIENKIQMTLYVHIGCLIERLIRNQPILGYSQTQLEKIPPSFFEVMKKVLSGIENKYSVTIPSSELGYLYDILYMYH